MKDKKDIAAIIVFIILLIIYLVMAGVVKLREKNEVVENTNLLSLDDGFSKILGVESEEIELSKVYNESVYFSIISLTKEFNDNIVNNKDILKDKLYGNINEKYYKYYSINIIPEEMYVKGTNEKVTIFLSGILSCYDFENEKTEYLKNIVYVITLNKTNYNIQLIDNISSLESFMNSYVSNINIDQNENNQYRLSYSTLQERGKVYYNIFKNYLVTDCNKAYNLLQDSLKASYTSASFCEQATYIYQNLSKRSSDSVSEEDKQYIISYYDGKKLVIQEKSLMSFDIISM